MSSNNSKTSAWEWSCRIHAGTKKHFLNGEEVMDHPLKPMVIVMNESRGASKKGGSTTTSTGSSTPTLPVLDPLGVALDGSDPLSQFAKQNQDPLSVMAADEWSGKKKQEFLTDEHLEPWDVRRVTILSKFTTSDKLSMVSSYLTAGEKVEKVQTTKTQSTVVKTRLEQLDDLDEDTVREIGDLSQQEYMIQIEQLNQELVLAWNQDQRVKALKIAIQCSKLLVDTSVIQFYPSKFVLITDILDIFGKLVYDRLKKKSESSGVNSKKGSLPDNFTPDMVAELAKETCRNWFYKIASIRELVPRLYVEAAILKSYNFLTVGEFSQALLRLTHTVRGIGDPLVAVYARCYLCRVGISVPNVNRQFLKENFYDFLASYHQLFGSSVHLIMRHQKIDLQTYLTLYTPALDMMLQALAHNAPESLLLEILGKCKMKKNSSLLLNAIMTAFKPAYIASRALHFIELISHCVEDGYPQYLLYRSLGLCLSASEPPSPQHILNEVWNYVSKLENPAHYIACAEVWLQFTVTHFTSREVNTFLGDVIRHMSPGRVFEQYYPQLQNIVDKILNNTQNFESLFTMDKFLPFMDMFRNEGIKVSVCKSIMTVFSNQDKDRCTNDPVIIDALMFICRIMHDSVNALTIEDEKRQIGLLISYFVRQVGFGRDFEQQLSFYVEARAAFSNLDSVHMTLVQCVNRLSVETGCIVKGHHTRKTAAFVRACSAYCFITIPSIASEFTKLQLYLLSAQVSLSNQCLGQADACLKAALSLIPELPSQIEVDGKMKSSEPYLVSYLCQFLSTLIVVPDSPAQGVLYLTRGLLNLLQNYTWEVNSTAKPKIFLQCLDYLNATAQQTYPYHVKKVDSNDVLYGSDPKFIAEVNNICSLLIEEILSSLKQMSPSEQAVMAFDMFVKVVIRADLSNPGLLTLAVNLWNLANKHSQHKSTVKTLEYLKRCSREVDSHVYAELITRLEGRT